MLKSNNSYVDDPLVWLVTGLEVDYSCSHLHAEVMENRARRLVLETMSRAHQEALFFDRGPAITCARQERT